MAFDFLDLFPDTPAAVAASQGARDLVENQHKASLGMVELENALMRTMQAKRQMAEQDRLDPLAKTAEALKIVQGLNLTGERPFEGIDLNDPIALRAFIQDKAARGEIMTNREVDLEKTKATGMNSYERALLQTQTQTKNNNNDNYTTDKKNRDDAAWAKAAAIEKLHPANMSPERAVKKLIPDLIGMIGSFGKDHDAVRGLLKKYAHLIKGTELDPAGKKKAAPKDPPTIVIDGYTFKKVNGQIVQVK